MKRILKIILALIIVWGSMIIIISLYTKRIEPALGVAILVTPAILLFNFIKKILSIPAPAKDNLPEITNSEYLSLSENHVINDQLSVTQEVAEQDAECENAIADKTSKKVLDILPEEDSKKEIAINNELETPKSLKNIEKDSCISYICGINRTEFLNGLITIIDNHKYNIYQRLTLFDIFMSDNPDEQEEMQNCFVDFVICASNDDKPVVAIQLYSVTDSLKRKAFVAQLFNEADLPLIALYEHERYLITELAEILQEILQ